ncbi:cell division protein SepF, partial [Bacillus cereus group sp. Bce025]
LPCGNATSCRTIILDIGAIWRFQRAVDKFFSWDTAEELCKAARDKKEIIPVRIYLGSGFKPDVVEYMR